MAKTSAAWPRRGVGRAGQLCGRSLSLLLLAWSLTACTSIRPLVKIGLVAPFEGLYRRSGYEALAALRLAVEQAPVPAPDLLPLALDGSQEAQRVRRALEKLGIDPAVRAVVGPLTPLIGHQQAAESLARSFGPALLWVAPYAVHPAGGMVNLWARADAADWAEEVVVAGGEMARRHRLQSLVLAGVPDAWPRRSAQEWREQAAMPVQVDPVADAVPDQALVLWLGDGAAGAGFWQELRERGQAPAFWLGPDVEGRVLLQHSPHAETVLQLAWLNPDYPAWAAQVKDATPQGFRVYVATRQVVGHLAGEPVVPQPAWEVWAVQVGLEAAPLPVEPVLAAAGERPEAGGSR